MVINTTILTILIGFIGFYYLFLYFISLINNGDNGDFLSEEKYFFFIVIPAKNEERVILKTLNNFMRIRYENFRVIVMNDGSTDRTRDIVKSFSLSNGKVLLMDNHPLSTSKGKGSVLNEAFNYILFFLRHNFTEPLHLPEDFLKRWKLENIVIGVFDADSSPDEDILLKVSNSLEKRNIDAIQTAVRISNGDDSLLARMQDIEFMGFSRVIQKARDMFGSVGLGGNGQFVKLSSLMKIGESPWGNSLTEDLELGLRLISKGMRIGFLDSSEVHQEGVLNMRKLIRQRTRWLQGHFTCWKYIPEIISSTAPLITRIDTIFYIVFVSVVLFVFFSISISLFSFFKIFYVKNLLLDTFFKINYPIGLFFLLVISFVFTPIFIKPILSYKKINVLTRLYYLILFIIYTYIWIPSAFAALSRIILGKREWLKTERFSKEELLLVPEEITSGSIWDKRKERRERVTIPGLIYMGKHPIPSLTVDVSKSGIGIIVKDIGNIKPEAEILFNDYKQYIKKKGKVVWVNRIDGGMKRIGVVKAG